MSIVPMKINPNDIGAIIDALIKALKNDDLAFSFPSNAPYMRAGDFVILSEFHYPKLSEDSSRIILPIEGTLDIIEKQIAVDGKLDHPITLTMEEIREVQEQINLAQTTRNLESTLREVDWSKVDPDNPGERVTGLIKDLQAVSADSQEGFEIVADLLKEHWVGRPNEKEIFTLFNKESLSIMNENNLKYIQDNMRYHGFGESLNPELESQIKKGAADFTMAYKTEVNKKEIDATLHFRKSDNSDMYFFNKYDVRTQAERKDEMMSQTFYINNGSGVTLKEAYNLLNGRAVHKTLTDKEQQKYQAWVQLDFGAKDKHGNYERKQYHQNYGYDLKETLSYYPIKEMANAEDVKTLMKSLEKGNVQMVTIEGAGKVFIEANPQYKTINLYDGTKLLDYMSTNLT